MKYRGYVEQFLKDAKLIIDNLERDKIVTVIEILYKAWKGRKQIFVMGNGGSAATASHFVCDLAKNTIVDGKKRFKVIGLTDNIPLMTSWANDSGFDNLFSEQLKNLIQKNDVVIAISSRGVQKLDKKGLASQNLLKATNLAKRYQAKVIGLTGFDGGMIKKLSDICINVPGKSIAHIEAIHLALVHLICNCLYKKIKRTTK